MRRSIEIVLCGTLLLIMLLPAAQRWTDVVNFEPLKGYSGQSGQPTLTPMLWFSGDFQEQFDDYASDSFGFTPVLVRLHNQLDYDLYRTANARYVVVGKEDYLYETAYVETILGLDFLGDSVINQKCRSLKEIESKLGTTKLMVVLAPGKGSFYPSYIPDFYERYRSDSTNFETYRQRLSDNGLQVLDFHSWFLSMKDTASYPLFPKTGIHWSAYGQALAADSLQRYLARSFDRLLPRYSWTIEGATTQAQGSDADIEEGMNLLRPLEHFEMAYPIISIDTTDAHPLKTCVIADSYYWGLFDKGFSSRASKDGEFWYYFNRVYGEGFERELPEDQEEVLRKLRQFDVVILLSTDATLDRFPWGLVGKVSSDKRE